MLKLAKYTKSWDCARIQASLDGTKVGSVMDFFNTKIVSEEFHLLDFWPEPGTHTLRLECVGKNAQSEGFYCGSESVRWLERRPRVTEMAHDWDKDWKQEPKLYR